MLKIPTQIFRKNSCEQGLRFNSVGDDITDEDRNNQLAYAPQQARMNIMRGRAIQSTHKPVNIIDVILQKHNYKTYNKQLVAAGIKRP